MQVTEKPAGGDGAMNSSYHWIKGGLISGVALGHFEERGGRIREVAGLLAVLSLYIFTPLSIGSQEVL